MDDSQVRAIVRDELKRASIDLYNMALCISEIIGRMLEQRLTAQEQPPVEQGLDSAL
jgi:hypothetical protein